MKTNDKTLADVQPGGRVRLGDSLRTCPFCGHSDFDEWPCEYIDASGANVVRCARCHAAAPMKVWHALSAQPSPGGQDALDCIGRIEEAIEFRVPHDIYAAVHGELAELKAALAARQPVGEPVMFINSAHLADVRIMPMVESMDEPNKMVPRNLAGINVRDEYHDMPLYAAPPAQAVDLAEIPDGWRLSKKATCYQLSHGNDIIGNLVGPDAEENAAIIARVLDSQAVGK